MYQMRDHAGGQNQASAQLIKSCPANDANIVLRVRETDCTYGVKRAQKSKQQKSRSSGVIYSRPRVLRSGKGPARTFFCKVITIYCVGGGGVGVMV